MRGFAVFARRGYADPLERIGDAEAVGDGALPELADLGLDGGWLEVVLIPDDATIWVLRGGELVEERRGDVPIAEVPAPR